MLVDMDGIPYTSDNNGYMLSDGVCKYTYNHANRLMSVTAPASTTSFVYNRQGNRVQ